MADGKREPRRMKASPGVIGAIRDAIDAVAKFAGPKAITQRRQKVDQAVDDAAGYEKPLGDEF